MTFFSNFADNINHDFERISIDMELQGKIIAVLPARSGVSARGEWKSQSFVIETHDNFPRKMVFDVFGEERLTRFNIQMGQEVNVSFDIDAHEYNGRWFNNIRAFDVRPADPNAAAPGVVAPAAPAASPEAPVAAPFPPKEESASGDDDLPF